MRLTKPQIALMESIGRDSESGFDSAGVIMGSTWMVPLATDNPKVLKSLEQKGLIEIDRKDKDFCFRLTKAGIGMINKIQANPHRELK